MKKSIVVLLAVLIAFGAYAPMFVWANEAPALTENIPGRDPQPFRKTAAAPAQPKAGSNEFMDSLGMMAMEDAALFAASSEKPEEEPEEPSTNDTNGEAIPPTRDPDPTFGNEDPVIDLTDLTGGHTTGGTGNSNAAADMGLSPLGDIGGGLTIDDNGDAPVQSAEDLINEISQQARDEIVNAIQDGGVGPIDAPQPTDADEVVLVDDNPGDITVGMK